MTTTVSSFHAAVKAAISARFGVNVNTVEWYEQGEKTNGQPKLIKTPAIILEMESADEGDDAGDDRDPLNCHISAYCILGQQTTDLQIQVRNFSAQLFALVRKNKWSLGRAASFPASITLGPGKFDPEKNGYESWFVSWEQTIYLGDDIWAPSGIVPTTVYLGESPLIGTGNEDQYTRVVPQ